MTRTVRRLPLVRARWLLAALLWVMAGTLAVSPVGARHAVAADAGSAVTVSGTGPFSSLKVTVSQTQGLIDQVVHVTWTGGAPTPGGFPADYLQIMQCWSDDPTGPDRTQCEFGNSGDHRGGDQVWSRQLDVSRTVVDPAETQVATTDNPYNYVPFESASWNDDPNNPGHKVHPVVGGQYAELGQYFDGQSTNEQPFNITGADGTGESFFETMTAQEAPGLGCGASTVDDSGATWSPHCWLVIVPRGETEVNGASYLDQGKLLSSPLSTTNWAHRLVVPLQFNPLAISCPIGSPEEPTNGQEIAAEALYRWQGQLCKQSGTVYSYSKASDDSSRRQLQSGDSSLNFLTQPVPPTARGASGVVYAPIAVSGAVIAFNVDYTLYGANSLRPRAGQRVPDINLTPRLVAKLITQSYTGGAPIQDPPLLSPPHPAGLTYDPDFYAANPGLTGLNNGGGDVLMPFTPSDLIQQLWQWVIADPDARAFLDGAADPWGMTVNPAYLHIGATSPPSSFPKSDTYCATPSDHLTYPDEPSWCTLDVRPYASDLHDSARAAARGDTLNRSFWDGTSIPPHFTKAARQIAGQQSVMAFTDAATAARYSLPVAHLRNSSGHFVAPDQAGLAAGLAGMKQSGVPGVVVPDPSTSNPDAYPLTSITYAATVPSALSTQARADYADFIQYAVTGGQEPGNDIGQLPAGYLPLPHSLVTQALTTSVGLRTYVSPPAPTTVTPTSAPTATRKPSPKPTKPKPTKSHATPTTSPVTSAPPTTTAPTSTFAVNPPVKVRPTSAPPTAAASSAPSSPASTSAAPTSAAASSPQPAASSAPPVKTIAEVTRTPGVSASPTRYALIVVLAIGGLCALSGPGLLRFGARRRR